MTYALLNTVFLGLALWFMVIAYVVAARRGANVGTRIYKILALTLLVMLITTAIFDNVIIGVGLVAYDPSTLLGVFIGNAPVEDFAYTVAGVMILPALWILLGTRKEKK
ncbi:small toxic polypeptide LdrA/B/C/D [Aurantimicrobium minutum]|uniref:lycopene cyclase domain-containing protein n=1 Tax=Aurantimicrobium minutum TaxID=708131 RepID=UPI0024731379|nr:lycopene cyclase domain-containing protein [Aurantimicrobium minutum]MDH6532053.1 small toxic polypeptide LdrA/B/C/D [Aurantimicrobium minutum]